MKSKDQIGQLELMLQFQNKPKPRKPKLVNCPTESQEQEQLITYCRTYKHLFLTYSAQNGIKISDNRKFGIIAKMKKEGMLTGLPDVCIPYARKGFHGLYIEMKRQKGGVLSVDQKIVGQLLKDQGYKVEVCKGFAEAKKIVDEYFNFI